MFTNPLGSLSNAVGSTVGNVVDSVGNIGSLGTLAKHVRVKVTATMKLTVLGTIKNVGIGQVTDGVSDVLLGSAIKLQLVSAELETHLGTTTEKKAVEGTARLNIIKQGLDEAKYEAYMQVPENFGKIGAVVVTNQHFKETFLKDIVIDGLPDGIVRINCESWIQSSQKRVFFAHQSYITEQTPPSLKELRKQELETLRGNGKGERKSSDRIYDYDVYNDLGSPDSKLALARPVLGSTEHPYPRRCRTGRPPCKTDPLSETRTIKNYVPKDEDFSDLKLATFGINVLENVLHALIPGIEAIFTGNKGFPSLKKIQELYSSGIHLPELKSLVNMVQLVPNLFQTPNVLRFPKPDVFERDELAWFRDEEFARETLAGLNPYAIRLVTEWPLISKLDPEIYGPPESAITTQLIEEQIKGFMSVTEALEQKKLFMLDYHDMMLPYVNKIREIESTTMYGSRTMFFLTPQGTLKPLAIELTRPPSDDGKKPQWKQVFTPSGDGDATTTWLWRLAKVHVVAHDSVYHQLVSHWLRTHCCAEPYILATNRQLSAMHPINRLMNPYFRYTMEINALARGSLVNAEGIIESTFATEKFSMEFSSFVYGKEWRFDHEALPADLISRGMAVEDPSAPHGLKLAIEDYPFANDGLLLWDTMKQWVTDYVNRYYPEPNLVESDQELQAWWDEVRNEGHKDLKDETWWPTLKTPDDLINIVTTIIWVSSGHHAAVNFGQYAYGGYFPNRPTIARKKMPCEDPTEEEWKKFLDNPIDMVLQTFPSQLQALKVMIILNALSNHSPDEEYIGDQIEPSWAEDPTVKTAFDNFNGKLKELEKTIDARNADSKLKNRYGAGTVPYELLKPFSKSGVTGMGVPNSISI